MSPTTLHGHDVNAPIGGSLSSVLAKLRKLIPAFGPRFVIGLDLGPRTLNMVQFDRTGTRTAIRAIASVPYTCSREELFGRPQELKALVMQAHALEPFKGRHVISTLPNGQTKIITVAYKRADGQSEGLAIVAELRERLQGELDDMVVDYMALRQDDHDRGEGEALVALAPRRNVFAYLELLTTAGLVVDALDVGPAALARLVRHVGARKWAEFPLAPNVLLINFGTEASFLTVIWGRRLMLDRAVEFCEQRLLSRMQQMLDLPGELALPLLYGRRAGGAAANDEAAEQTVAEVLRPEITALLEEINKTLIYTASKTRGRSVDVIYLAGPGACHSGIVRILAEQLQVPVEILNPVSVFATAASGSTYDPHQELGMSPGVALATGLALRGLPVLG